MYRKLPIRSAVVRFSSFSSSFLAFLMWVFLFLDFDSFGSFRMPFCEIKERLWSNEVDVHFLEDKLQFLVRLTLVV